MSRISLIHSYFQKKDRLTVKNPVYVKTLDNLWQWFTQADDAANDITTNTLQFTGNGTAQIIAKQNGIIAGVEEISFLVSSYIRPIRLMSLIWDGSTVHSGDTILQLSGPVSDILAYERTILNMLGRMSGIATTTHNIISKLPNIPNSPAIAATRKTPWMLLDKKAVAIGGGLTHRLSLSDSILIKDNHLVALSQCHSGLSRIPIETTIKKVFEKSQYAEIEVATPSQANDALSAFSTIQPFDHITMCLLLDNWSSETVKKFVAQVKKTPIYNRVLFEASGEITEENIKNWSQTGVDILSLGTLTHSAKNFNLSMKIT